MAAYLMSLDPEGEWYNDPDGMAQYGQNVPKIIESFGGTYLLMRREPEVLEGGWNPGPIVLIRFPSKERFREFYESAAYKPWLELRKRAGQTRLVIVED